MNLIDRRRMGGVMDWLLRHEPALHYNQLRPMDWTRYKYPDFQRQIYSGRGMYADCSESVTAIFKWSGCKDPNGNGYNGYGSTYTMYDNLVHFTNMRLAKRGSLVHFVNPDHVSIVYRPDFIRGNPLLFSFGSEHGPRLYRLNDERGWHPGPVVGLNVSKL